MVNDIVQPSECPGDVNNIQLVRTSSNQVVVVAEILTSAVDH